MTSAVSPAASLPIRWAVVGWFSFVLVGAIVAVWYMIAIRFSWATVCVAFVEFSVITVAITVVAHRLYSHEAFKMVMWLQYVFAAVLPAAFQGFTDWWAALHRRHHGSSDGPNDPYSALHGFWWAHIRWMWHDRKELTTKEARSLVQNPALAWQRRNYAVLAVTVSFVFPTIICGLWGDWLGGLLVAGFLRLFVQYQLTWSINSVAHTFGARRYAPVGSARTSVPLAILTGGEAFHHEHHLAPHDYRLGRRWYDPDPGKWLIWTLSLFGLTYDLVRAPEEAVRGRVDKLVRDQSVSA